MSLRPTSKLPAPAAPKPQPKRDPLPWWAGALALAVLATVVRLAATSHPAIPRAALVIGTAAGAILWRTPFITRRFRGHLYGRGRTGCTVVFLAGNGIALAGYWQADGLWWLTVPALAVWCTTAIGGGGNLEQLRERFRMAHATVTVLDGDDAARAVHDADRGLKVFRQAVAQKYPGAKVSAPTVTTEGFAVMVNSDQPIPTAFLAWTAGRAFGYPQNDILVADLSYEGRTGTYKVVIGAPVVGPARPWDMDAPDVPPSTEWPPLCFPLGWTTEGILWAPLTIHWLVAGITDSGKSNTLNVIIDRAREMKFGLALIDPKQTELYPWRDHAAYGEMYADDGESILRVLRAVEGVRRQRMQLRREKGIKSWDTKYGPRVLLVIDEMAEAIKLAPAAADLIDSLARLARAEGIVLVIADQHPTEKSFPTTIKRNMPNVVCHRVSDGGAARVALGESITSKGFDPADETIPQGGAVAKVQSVGTQWVKVFREGQIPPAAQPSQPASTPPHVPTSDKVAEVADNPTSATNATPSPDTRTTRQIIEENLYPDDPITAVVLAKLTRTSEQNVRKILAKMVDEGAAEKQRGGWVSVASKDRAA